VDDNQLAAFFSELASLTKRVSVDIIPFDTTVEERDVFEWRKGANPQLQRVRGGGTDFNAPTAFVNDPKNRARWDGLLIMSDGECCAPTASRVKRGWVLSKGHKLLFDTNELQVFLDDSKPMQGAWR
jgi:predicted metal-dependent peptidase